VLGEKFSHEEIVRGCAFLDQNEEIVWG